MSIANCAMIDLLTVFVTFRLDFESNVNIRIKTEFGGENKTVFDVRI